MYTKKNIKEEVSSLLESFLRNESKLHVFEGGVSLLNAIPEDDLLSGTIVLYSGNDALCAYDILHYVENFYDLFTYGAEALKELEEDIAWGVIANTPDEYIIAEEA